MKCGIATVFRKKCGTDFTSLHETVHVSYGTLIWFHARAGVTPSSAEDDGLRIRTVVINIAGYWDLSHMIIFLRRALAGV